MTVLVRCRPARPRVPPGRPTRGATARRRVSRRARERGVRQRARRRPATHRRSGCRQPKPLRQAGQTASSRRPLPLLAGQHRPAQPAKCLVRPAVAGADRPHRRFRRSPGRRGPRPRRWQAARPGERPPPAVRAGHHARASLHRGVRGARRLGGRPRRPLRPGQAGVVRRPAAGHGRTLPGQGAGRPLTGSCPSSPVGRVPRAPAVRHGHGPGQAAGQRARIARAAAAARHAGQQGGRRQIRPGRAAAASLARPMAWGPRSPKNRRPAQSGAGPSGGESS